VERVLAVRRGALWLCSTVVVVVVFLVLWIFSTTRPGPGPKLIAKLVRKS
jgi:hypothetical protein